MKFRGADFLLQVLADDNVTWLTTLSDRSTSIAIGNEFVDTTSKSNTNGWRESATPVGIRTAETHCSGVVVDATSGPALSKLLARSLDGAAFRIRVIHDTTQETILEGLCICTGLERAGEYNGAEMYNVTLVGARTQMVNALAVTASSAFATVEVPGSLAFFSTVSGGVPGYTYAWTFSNGSTSTDANPVVSFTTIDAFTATVVVTDSQGNTATSNTVAFDGVGITGAAGTSFAEILESWTSSVRGPNTRSIGLADVIESQTTISRQPNPASTSFSTRTQL